MMESDRTIISEIEELREFHNLPAYIQKMFQKEGNCGMLKPLASQKRESCMVSNTRYIAKLKIEARNSESAVMHSLEGDVHAETPGKLMTLMVEEAAALQVEMKFWELLQPHPEKIGWLSSIRLTPLLPNYQLYQNEDNLMSGLSSFTSGKLGFYNHASICVRVLYASTENRLNCFGLKMKSPFGQVKEEDWDKLFAEAEAQGALRELLTHEALASEAEAIWKASEAPRAAPATIAAPTLRKAKKLSLRNLFSR